MNSEWVTFKDIFYLVIGLALGFLLGIAAYWLPLRQLGNELRALLNLVKKQYSRNEKVSILPGVALKSLDGALELLPVAHERELIIWHDEGVNWYHTDDGWKRARVLQVFQENQTTIFRCCHLDIKI